VGTQPNLRRLTRTPKYVTIRNLLRDRILAGRYGLGNRLPSESALMSQFAVSRVTVRLTLGALREVGLVESRQGKGISCVRCGRSRILAGSRVLAR